MWPTRLITAALALAIATPAVAAPVSLAPHRAVYDLKLKDASERSGISGIVGRMVYEFNGSACDGYTTSFRFVTRILTGEDSRLTDQQTTTFESASGDAFEFSTRSFVDQKPEREVRGSARRDASGLEVDLKQPEEAEITLQKALFPTAHMVDLLQKAERGETFYEAPIFDGSDDADRTMTTTVIIGRKASEADGDAAPMGALGKDAWWPVSISYFDETDTSGEGLPEYRIGFKLYHNGVTRDLEMDYGDFSMEGKLKDLTLLDKPECG